MTGFFFFVFTDRLPGTSGAVEAGADGSLPVTHWISPISTSSLFGLCVSSTSPATSGPDEVGPSTAGLEASLVGGQSSSMSMSGSKGWHQLSAHKRNWCKLPTKPAEKQEEKISLFPWRCHQTDLWKATGWAFQVVLQVNQSKLCLLIYSQTDALRSDLMVGLLSPRKQDMNTIV